MALIMTTLRCKYQLLLQSEPVFLGKCAQACCWPPPPTPRRCPCSPACLTSASPARRTPPRRSSSWSPGSRRSSQSGDHCLPQVKTLTRSRLTSGTSSLPPSAATPCRTGNLRSAWQSFKAPGFRDPRYSSLPWSCPRPPGPEPLPLLLASHLAYQVLHSSYPYRTHTESGFQKIIHSLTCSQYQRD